MTVVHVATISCDACPAQNSSVRDTFGCGGPENWGELNWQQPKIDNAGSEYKELHLCPQCRSDVLKWIADRRAAQATS